MLRNLGETLALLYDFSKRWMHPIDGKWVNNLAFVSSAVLKKTHLEETLVMKRKYQQNVHEIFLRLIYFYYSILPYWLHLSGHKFPNFGRGLHGYYKKAFS